MKNVAFLSMDTTIKQSAKMGIFMKNANDEATQNSDPLFEIDNAWLFKLAIGYHIPTLNFTACKENNFKLIEFAKLLDTLFVIYYPPYSYLLNLSVN